MINTIIGIFIGAFISLASTVVYDRYKEHRTRKRLALAISNEIQSLYKLTKEKLWHDVITDNRNFVVKVELTATYNYFVVYESHSDLISLFEHPLIENIVHFYNRAKSFLEDIKIYSDLTQDSEEDVNYVLQYRHNLKQEYETLQQMALEIIKLADKEEKKKFLFVIP